MRLVLPALVALTLTQGAPPLDGRADHPARDGSTGDRQIMQNGLQELVFKRSGGPVHLTLSGTVTFEQGQATETSDSAPGSRKLSAEEIAMWERQDISLLKEHAAPQRPGRPDRYQYDVTLKRANAAPVEIRFYEEAAAELNERAAGLGELAAWVRHEIAAIWQRRVAPRP